MTIECCGTTISDYGQKILRIINIASVLVLGVIGVIMMTATKDGEPAHTAGILLLVAGIIIAIISIIVYCVRTRQQEQTFFSV